MKKYLCLLTVIFLLLPLFGCAQEGGGGTEETEPRGIGAMGSEVWETMPALTYGEFEYEKLQVLEWNSGRCEATSVNRMAETENGYYKNYATNYTIQYADKTDLSNWVAVCNQPNCSHNTADSWSAGDPICRAKTAYEMFLIRNDRIYLQLSHGDDQTVYKGDAGFYIASMAADGTDKKFEYAIEYIPASSKSYMGWLTSQAWFYNLVELNTDGTQTAYAYRVSEKGVEQLAVVENYEGTCLLRSSSLYNLFGDELMINGVLDASWETYYRYTDSGVEELKASALPIRGGYLSGDVLRFFRVNDGYYDRNIKTGEEVKLADAQLENSFASVVLPNCIIESTLMAYYANGTDEYYTEGMEHQMVLFDGESWRDVAIPDELRDATGKKYVQVLSVTSDSIIFFSRDMETFQSTGLTEFYRIDLNQENLSLEYMAESVK